MSIGEISLAEVMVLNWERLLTDRDKQVFSEAGYGNRQALGKSPALVVVDVTYEFVGFKPEPILESIKTFPTSCGEEGWQSVQVIQELLPLARSRKIPVIYTNVYRSAKLAVLDPWSGKKKENKWQALDEETKRRGMEFVKEIKPRDEELVITKHAPSAFWGTPLVYYLQKLGIDSLLVTGCTTSGCVRATVVDAFSYGYTVNIVEEAVFDRIEASHIINLFDMQAKFANVLKAGDVREYLANLA